MANLKAQGLYDVADPDHDHENSDTYAKELFKRKRSFVYSVLVTSYQTEKVRDMVKECQVHHLATTSLPYKIKCCTTCHHQICCQECHQDISKPQIGPPKGEDQPQDLTSDMFVYGRPNADGSDNPPPMSIINFDDILGRTFLLLMDVNGERKRATISEHVKEFVNNKSQEKISSDSSSRLMETNLITSFHITNLWNI